MPTQWLRDQHFLVVYFFAARFRTERIRNLDQLGFSAPLISVPFVPCTALRFNIGLGHDKRLAFCRK